ncbi:unnamed protein product [Schistosoma rodhaini]|uniref:Protein kinase domain-containing protein n=1 Tax=Schistosoma rodhaini TaxID=6188 RepID=A0AA85EU65_9TREM|nr:unnamed protein product [Schistosoma rodhaini]CAH8492054.1 unnamed protein product [Schistosoma rodhaini]
MSSRRDSCLRLSKPCFCELSNIPHHSWKNLCNIEGGPIGRGFAGKVYKITTSNMELLDPLIAKKSQLAATVYSDITYVEPGEYLACKVIRRFRGGKDTISKITSEVQAMVSLQRDHLNTYHNSVYNKPSEKPSKICNNRLPPKSASPTLFAVYKDSMEVAIIMEYASGGSLYDLCRSAYLCDFAASSTGSPCGDLSVRNSGVSNPHTTIPQSKHPGSFDGLPESYIRQLLTSILEALVYMHDTLRMVHLDVKAENLLLRQPYPSTDVFFTDFGLATILTEGKQHRELAGTPDYVAPEIINYDPITFATDMWSVGVLTYYLLTGISPFLGEDKYITMQNITHGTITYPDSLFNNRSPDSIDFIQRLLQRSPTQRMSAKECLNHPWLLQSFNQPIIIETEINHQSSETTLYNNENSISDDNNVKYAIELFHIDPIVEIVNEFMSPVCLTQFIVQSPVYIVPYVDVVSQTNFVKLLPSLKLCVDYLPVVNSALSTQFTPSINNHPSSSEQSIRKISKKLINGHFNLLDSLSELTKICSIDSDNDNRYVDTERGYQLMNRHLMDIHDKSRSLTSYYKPSINSLWNSNLVEYNGGEKNKSSENYVSISVFISNYLQEYQLFLMFCDLNYDKLLHRDFYFFESDNTTNIVGSSCSSIKKTIVTNAELFVNFPLSSKMYHPKQQQRQPNEIMQSIMIGHDETKKELIKISKYTTDIMPKVNEIIPKKFVNSHISTIRIELNSSISEKFKRMNSSDDNYNFNHTRDYLSYDFFRFVSLSINVSITHMSTYPTFDNI